MASYATAFTTGILGSLRTLGGSLLATVQDRIELFSVELQEEKFRLIQLFTWISAAVFAAVMTITFTSLTLVYFFWESARFAVLGGLATFYAISLVAIILSLRRFIVRQPAPFSATRQELSEDIACIQKTS
jgi:uncharacterized membrane protein YqjE